MLINLVIDKNYIKHRCSENDFLTADFSNAWLNTLEKETGKSTVFDTSADPAMIFSSSPIIVVSSSVRDPSDEFMEKAKKFVSSGGILIVEMPSDKWNHVLERNFMPGGVGISPVNEESGLNRLSPRILPFPFIEYLEKMPLFTRILNMENVPDDMEILFNIGKTPGLVQLQHEKGWVLILMMDFAMQLTAMKQGIPTLPQYGVKERFGKVPLVIETEDLALNGNMLDNPVPYADIFEKFLMAAIEDLIFFPRLWYFPADYDGVFMMSHDDEKRGKKKSMYMVDEEGSRGFTSTFFATCPPGADSRWEKAEEDILGKGFDIQWHWNRFPDNIKIYSPEEQVENFSRITGTKLTSCRIHFLNWGNHYTEPFRVMDKLGILLDSSYGPNKAKGFVFGTGMPFHPMDTDGNLFSISEIPFQTQEDWAGVTTEYFGELLQNSSQLWHSVIIPLFHPHKTAMNEGRAMWLNTFHQARENNHWITTFSEFGDFWKKRCEIEMGQYQGNEKTPQPLPFLSGSKDPLPLLSGSKAPLPSSPGSKAPLPLLSGSKGPLPLAYCCCLASITGPPASLLSSTGILPVNQNLNLLSEKNLNCFHSINSKILGSRVAPAPGDNQGNLLPHPVPPTVLWAAQPAAQASCLWTKNLNTPGKNTLFIPMEKLLSKAGIHYIPGVHPEGYYIDNIPPEISGNIALRIPLEKEWTEEAENESRRDGNEDKEKNKKNRKNEGEIPESTHPLRVITDAGRHYLLVNMGNLKQR